MQIREKLSNELDREPTVEEIAKEMGKSKSEIVIALEAIVEPVSFYEPVYSNGGDTIYLMDQLGTNESDGDWIDEISMKEALRNLPPREMKILSMRFMKGMTQTEVAAEIGISQAQVSRLEKSAISYVKGEK
jgi:RNA polymerase sporulation-specific sigma factor